jgi:DNA-binding GntR family transcriptional regulator
VNQHPRGAVEVVDPYTLLSDIPSVGGTTADRLYVALEEAVIDRVLPPGTHLEAETLCRRYGVSMIPVRESLRTLQANGWVVIKPHHGAFVVSGTEAELADLYEARVVLETAASELAAVRRTDDDLRRLDKAVVAGTEIVTSGALHEFARLNSEFHERVAEATHNSTLIAVQRRLSQRVRFYSSVLTMDRVQRSVEEHAALADAIKNRDHVNARAIAEVHIGESKAKVSERLPTNPRASG